MTTAYHKFLISICALVISACCLAEIFILLGVGA